MSDIIAERIPALLNAAPAQTRRVGERVRNNLAKLHELLDADPNGWSACYGPKAAGTCCYECFSHR